MAWRTNCSCLPSPHSLDDAAGAAGPVYHDDRAMRTMKDLQTLTRTLLGVFFFSFFFSSQTLPFSHLFLQLLMLSSLLLAERGGASGNVPVSAIL